MTTDAPRGSCSPSSLRLEIIDAPDAVGLLVSEGRLDAERCLRGFPHPSGADGHRKVQFDARRNAPTDEVARWLA